MKKEIVVILLLFLTTTFMIYVVESFVYLEDNNLIITKSMLSTILFWSLIKAFMINIGIVFFYYLNKNRIKNNKRPI